MLQHHAVFLAIPNAGQNLVFLSPVVFFYGILLYFLFVFCVVDDNNDNGDYFS